MSSGFKRRQRNPAEEVAEFKSKRGFTQKGVDDLVMLPKITEGEIVENLQKRHSYDAIYTNIGPVLIVVNPYKELGLTGDDYVRLYKGKFRHELPPHVFALAEETYRAMKSDKTDQCVIISGESGAGKTVAAKQIMQYIAAVSGHSDKVEFIKSVILDSNPLLEAFGNAKTIRNNNSSRFGKYFEINFDARGDPIGGKITNYLLEKSRVVYQQQGERSFHFFYQLLIGADQSLANRLQLYSPEHFHYVNQSGCYTVDDIDDAKDFQEVVSAMKTMGISDQERDSIFEIIAGILHLGNIPFGEDDRGNAYISDRTELEITAKLWKVPMDSLEYCLLFRQMTSGTGNRTEVFQSPLNLVQADGTRNAMARDLYDRMFSWLVEKVNVALDRWKLAATCVIGILDIFGFEIFEHNGFEQFCINFVNEKLQQYFIEKTLKEEQEEYVAEGIQWTPIKFFNNKIVCDLIEGKSPPGLFSLLDDICATIHAQSEGADDQFLRKADGVHGQHAHWKSFTGAFSIKHYAGDVAYEAQGFTDKNKDQLFQECVDCLRSSQNRFISVLFPVTEEEKAAQTGQRRRPTTAGFKIKNSANLLMQTLSKCTPHYIRCIKPNDVKKAGNWDQERVRHQVQYLGLLENVKVRRAGFAFRAPFERFLRRYKKLSKATWGTWGEWKGDAREGCQQLLGSITSLEAAQWQFGKTKVFIRHPESVFHLEELLERKDFEEVCKIQRAWRMWRMRKKALEQRAAAAQLLRGRKERRRDSMDRNWTGDYVQYEDNFPLQDLMDPYKEELVLFADEVLRLNKNGKLEKRTLLVTDGAVYICMRAVKKVEGKKALVWSITRRTLLSNIGTLSMSTLADGYICMHIPNEHDTVVECDRKTEMVMILRELFHDKTNRELPVNLTDSISYHAKDKDTKEKVLQFLRDEQAIPLVQQQETTKAKMKSFFSGNSLLKIGVPSGLPKDTDTTPKGFHNTAPRSAGGPPRGGGRGRGRGNTALKNMPSAQTYDLDERPDEGEQQEQPRQAPRSPRAQQQQATQQRALPQASAGAGRARGGATQGAGRALPQATGVAGRAAAPVGGRALPSAGGRGAPAQGGAGRAQAPQARAPAAAPRAPSKPKAKALYDYSAGTDDELSFSEGDILTVLQKDPGGWWEAELSGRRGWVPANYVEEQH